MAKISSRVRGLFSGVGGLLFATHLFAANTITTNQLGQGVVYKHYHYDSLYNSLQEVYLIDVNLNDPAPSLAIPYRTNGLTRTVSQHAATVPGAVACVNGQFFTSIGSIQYLKVAGTVVNVTQPAVHDGQALTDTGTRQTNSIGVTLRPGGGWASLAVSNIVASGPDLIQNGVKFTAYDTNDTLVTTRNPRTCAASTYDNHLLLMVVDGRSGQSAGMTLPELRDHLYSLASIKNAFNFDGGGSSTMWTTNGVVNSPSDGQSRGVADAITIVIVPPVIPPAPANLLAAGGSGQISLQWSPSSGATSYNVKRSTTNGGPYTVITNLPGTTFTNINLAGGTTYYYTITASNSAGQSSNSTQASALTAPSAPAILMAEAGTNQVALHWSATFGAASYNIKHSSSLTGTYTAIAVSSSTNYTNFGLPNNTTYYYVVSAVNGSGESPNSTVTGATTACPVPAAPAGLTAKMTNGQIVLNWNPSAGATGYQIARATSSGGSFALLSATGQNVEVDTDVQMGTTYYYQVTATNSCGLSGGSAGASAPLLLTLLPSGTNIISAGWGGTEGQSYYVLTVTNLAQPASNWTRLETNLFGPWGSFRFTNHLDPVGPHRFWMIQSLPP